MIITPEYLIPLGFHMNGALPKSVEKVLRGTATASHLVPLVQSWMHRYALELIEQAVWVYTIKA